MHWTTSADPSVTSLPALVRARMRDPAKVFIRNGDGRTFTYGEIWDLAGRLAGALRAHGVGVGDRVAVQVDKSPEAIVLFLACARAGAVFLPLNTAYTLNEVDYFVGDAEPRVIVATPARLAELTELGARHRRRRDAVARDGRRRHADGRGGRATGRVRRREARLGRPRRHPLHLGHHRALEGRDDHPRQPRLERPRPDRGVAVHRPRRPDPRPARLPRARPVHRDQHDDAVGRRNAVPGEVRRRRGDAADAGGDGDDGGADLLHPPPPAPRPDAGGDGAHARLHLGLGAAPRRDPPRLRGADRPCHHRALRHDRDQHEHLQPL